jgi:hypothetical protein
MGPLRGHVNVEQFHCHGNDLEEVENDEVSMTCLATRT